MSKETQAQVAEQQSEQPAANGNTELTIADLNALKVIIDVASQRGAFKPNEMETVGKTYTKLENFLLAVQAQQAQAEGKTEEAANE